MSTSGEDINLAPDLPNSAIDIAEQKPDVRQAFDTTTRGASNDITAALGDADDNNQLLVLGSGTYTISGSVSLGGNLTGLVGAGSDSTTIEISGTHNYIFGGVSCSIAVIEGVTFDLTGGGACGFGRFEVSDRGWFEDVAVRGQRDRLGNGTGRFSWMFEAVNSDAANFIHKFVQPDGDTIHTGEDTVGHAIPFSADPDHEGLNVWKECHVEGFIDNGYYVSNSPGQNVLWNCTAKDNRGGNMRVDTTDIIVGGSIELTSNAPGAATGHGLTVDTPSQVRVIGLWTSGDSYGNLLHTRGDAREVTLDRVVAHGTDTGYFARLDGAPATVDVQGGWWLDVNGSGVRVQSANVSADSNLNYQGSFSSPVNINGQSFSSGLNAGLGDPQPFPNFHFDGVESGGGSDYAGWSSDGRTGSRSGGSGFIDGSGSPGSRWGLVEPHVATIETDAVGQREVTVEPQWFNTGGGGIRTTGRTGGTGGTDETDGIVGVEDAGITEEWSGDEVNVRDYGAVGDGETDDTDAILSAISDVEADGDGVHFPAGEYPHRDQITVPDGVRLRGDGPEETTLKTTDAGNQTSFDLNPGAVLRDFALDQNTSDRGHASTTGVMMQECSEVLIENVTFTNISVSDEGVGIYMRAEESHSQGIFNNSIRNCDITGNWSNENDSGDFLIRAWTNFNSDLSAAEFENIVEKNHIDGCSFSGECKSSVELVGPATRDNFVAGCVAEGVETCVGIFEASLGAKSNTYSGCEVVDCFATARGAAFYSDGRQSVGGSAPRYSEDNTFEDCSVRGFTQLEDDTTISGFRLRRDRRAGITNCAVSELSVPSRTGNSYKQAFDITRSSDPKIDGATVDTGGVTFDMQSADDDTIGTVEVTESTLSGTTIASHDMNAGTLSFTGCDFDGYTTGITGSYGSVVVDRCSFTTLSKTDVVTADANNIRMVDNTFR